MKIKVFIGGAGSIQQEFNDWVAKNHPSHVEISTCQYGISQIALTVLYRIV